MTGQKPQDDCERGTKGLQMRVEGQSWAVVAAAVGYKNAKSAQIACRAR